MIGLNPLLFSLQKQMNDHGKARSEELLNRFYDMLFFGAIITIIVV